MPGKGCSAVEGRNGGFPFTSLLSHFQSIPTLPGVALIFYLEPGAAPAAKVSCSGELVFMILQRIKSPLGAQGAGLGSKDNVHGLCVAPKLWDLSPCLWDPNSLLCLWAMEQPLHSNFGWKTPSAPLPGKTASCPSAAGLWTHGIFIFWGPCVGKLPSNGRTCCVSLQPLSARGDRAEGLFLPGEGKCSVPQPAPPARHICASVLCDTKSQTCGEGMGGSWAAWGWEHPQPCSLLPCTTGSQRSVNTDKQAHGWATDGISSPL